MSQTAAELAAREALRQRQGDGARYDAPGAPDDALLLARRGAAFFARTLNGLTDDDLDGPSARATQSRRHIIAEVNLSAREMAIAIKAVRGGITEEEAGWRANVPMTVTLPARALRFLYAHSDIHLNVEFRDLLTPQWGLSADLKGPIAVRDLPLMRARSLWLGALDLNAGARRADLPDALRSERV